MSQTVPAILPTLSINLCNAGSPKRVDTIPNDSINNMAHEGPSDTRDTKIVALRLKFNAFKALKGEEVSDSDVDEDTRSSSKFLADLNAEFHDKALLDNHKIFYKRSGRVGSARKPIDKSNETCFACEQSEKRLVAELFDWDEESLSSEDGVVTRVKAFMAIVKDELAVGKSNASKVTLDHLLTEQVPRNIACALGGGKRKEKFSLKKVMFTKSDESPSKTIPKITSDSESECENQEPLPPLPKLLRTEPIGTSNDVIPLANLTQTLTVFEKTKQVTNKESSVKVIKKKAQTKSPSITNPNPVKKYDSSTEKLLLSLMKEVKGLKDQIKPPSDNSGFVSQTWSSKS
nr:hypothetical protein [Tanacetum cinerariifolium]